MHGGLKRGTVAATASGRSRDEALMQAAGVASSVAEHRWTIPCELAPDQAEKHLGDVLAELTEEGWELIPHVETVGFFGWTARGPDERAVGISIPQPSGPPTLMVRSDHEDLGQQVVDLLTRTGPLEGHDARHGLHEPEALDDTSR